MRLTKSTNENMIIIIESSSKVWIHVTIEDIFWLTLL